MTGREHVIIGAGSTLLVIGTAQYAHGAVDFNVLVPAGIAAVAGSLAPDLDHPRSLASLSIPTTLVSYAGAFLFARYYESTHPHALVRWLTGLGPEWARVAWISLGAGLALLALSIVLGARFGHRGVVHSVAFGLLASLVFAGIAWVTGWPLWLTAPFAWGWLAHLAADALTPAGLKAVLWPLAGRARG